MRRPPWYRRRARQAAGECREHRGGVRAVFADGSDATGVLLIGRDGVHSIVRRIIEPAAPAPHLRRASGDRWAMRGVSTARAEGSYTTIFGNRAFFAVAPNGDVWLFANVPRRREAARGEPRRSATQSGGTGQGRCSRGLGPVEGRLVTRPPCPSALQEKSSPRWRCDLCAVRADRAGTSCSGPWSMLSSRQRPALCARAGVRRRWGRSRPGCASPVVSLTGFEPTLRP
jgi:hypothetical protein